MSIADTIDVALRAEISQYANKMDEADRLTAKAVGSIDSKFKRLGSTIAGLAGGLTLASIMQKSVQAFSESEQGAIRLDSVLSSMGRGTSALSEEMKKLANQLQSEGIISDDEIIRGQAMLATFDTISNEALPRATRVMADFAAMTGGDARTAAMLLGRASAGMTETLARYGIVLPDSVKKSGDFNQVLGEIEKKIGGMNKALGESASGSLKKFANAWDDVLESIGSVVTFGMSNLLASEKDIKRWGEAAVVVFDFVGDELDLISRVFMTAGETIGASMAKTMAVVKLEWGQVSAISEDYQKRLDEIWDPQKFSDRRKEYMAALESGSKFKSRNDFKTRDTKKEKEDLEAIARAQSFQNEVFDDYLKQLDDYNEKMFTQSQALKDAADPTRVLQRELKRYDELLEVGAIDIETWGAAVMKVHSDVADAIEQSTNRSGDSVDEMTLFMTEALKQIQGAMTSLLEDVLLGKVDNFEKAFKKMLARIAANLAASKILELLLGKDGKSGLAGQLGNAVVNYFSGGATAAPANAMGGSVQGGQPITVGERGTEVFVPKTDGMIVSNEQLARGGGTSVSVQNVFNISTGVAETVRAEMNTLAPMIEERSRLGVLAAIERGGTYAKAVNRRA